MSFAVVSMCVLLPVGYLTADRQLRLDPGPDGVRSEILSHTIMRGVAAHSLQSINMGSGSGPAILCTTPRK